MGLGMGGGGGEGMNARGGFLSWVKVGLMRIGVWGEIFIFIMFV